MLIIVSNNQIIIFVRAAFLFSIFSQLESVKVKVKPVINPDWGCETQLQIYGKNLNFKLNIQT